MRLKEKVRTVVVEDLDSLSRDLASLEAETEDEGGQTTDILFQVGGGDTENGEPTAAAVGFRGHSAIFRARCSRWSELAVEAITAEPKDLIVIRLVRARPDAFRALKHFIYSGRVELEPPGSGRHQLLDLLGLASLFGVESLLSLGLGQVRSSLSLGLATEMLNAATAAASQDLEGPDRERLTDPVLTFIVENLGALRERHLLLNLTRPALVGLLHSLRLRSHNENEIWRLCAEWGRGQAGIEPRPPHTWTEKERAAMRTALHGVVQHVRLLAIDSGVFAEEVEPTGAVPIELSLERYRQAALHLPDKFPTTGGQNSSSQQQQQLAASSSNSRVENARALPATAGFVRSGDAPPGLTRPPPLAATNLSRLNPRVEAPQVATHHLLQHPPQQGRLQQQQHHPQQPVPRQLFHGSGILAGLAAESSAFGGHYEKLLNSWAGSPPGQAWTLIFRASEHGFSAAAFHRMCDGAAPSYVLVKADTGESVSSSTVLYLVQ